MKEYDVIVIGSGAGMNVGANALDAGSTVALVEHGVLGGTCLNNGCIPSKVLLYPADVIRRLQEAERIGVQGKITRIDFSKIMDHMRAIVDEGRTGMEKGVTQTKEVDWYKDTGEFIDEYTMKVGEHEITAPKIIIASGSRPFVPDIKGLQKVGFLDNVSVLDLKRPPKSLVIIGGGYIACEYGHFFSAMGTKVTILGRNPRLLKEEEPEVSDMVKKAFSRYVDIRTNTEVSEVKKGMLHKEVTAMDRGTGEVRRFNTDEIMLAAGRISNADLLRPERTGVEVDEGGWIRVNEYLETTKENIWALGDATGKYLFRHTANAEAGVVWKNAFTERKVKVDQHAIPHAVFGFPQVGSVGLTEREALAAGHRVLVGKANYMDVTKGYAAKEEDSLVKVVVDADTRRILGCHIVGSEAAELVQQVVYLMNAGDQTYTPLTRAQVIHPALSEIVINAFSNMKLVGHGPGHEQDHGHDG